MQQQFGETMNKTQQNLKANIFMSIIFFIVGVAVIGIGVKKIEEISRFSKYYETTNAQVVGVKTSYAHESGESDTYAAVYKYTVDGVEYEDSESVYSSEYPVIGQSKIVRYDPDNPEKNYIEGSEKTDYFLICIGILFVGAAVLMLMNNVLSLEGRVMTLIKNLLVGGMFAIFGFGMLFSSIIEFGFVAILILLFGIIGLVVMIKSIIEFVKTKDDDYYYRKNGRKSNGCDYYNFGDDAYGNNKYAHGNSTYPYSNNTYQYDNDTYSYEEGLKKLQKFEEEHGDKIEKAKKYAEKGNYIISMVISIAVGCLMCIVGLTTIISIIIGYKEAYSIKDILVTGTMNCVVIGFGIYLIVKQVRIHNRRKNDDEM